MVVLFALSAPNASASAKDGEATVYEGNTVTVSISSAYQYTLKEATGISYKWTPQNSSYITVTSSNKNSATIKGLKATSSTRLYYYCSYYIDGYYRTMDFYYDITVKSSTVYVTKVVVSPSSATLTEGETLKLSATVSPSNATNRSVTWSSGNKSVATVSSSGLVTAKSVGSTTITCTAADGSGKYGQCSVTVKASTVYVSKISLNQTSATLTEGETLKLTATVTPSNATNKSVTWSSNNTSVATVSSSGLVTAKQAGTATISCKASDGSGVKATCSITVKSSDVPVASIELNKTVARLTVGDTLHLIANISPNDATDKTITWASDNSTIATVDKNGLVTAINAGDARITATTSNGLNAYCNVTVLKEGVITGLSVATPSSLEVGETDYMKVSYRAGSTVSFTFTSSDPSIAEIDNSGKITAKKGGRVMLTVKEAYSGIDCDNELYVISNTWAGTYNIKAAVVTSENATRTYPNNFTMTIQRKSNKYFITSFLFEDQHFVPYNDGNGLPFFTVDGNEENEAMISMQITNFVALDDDTKMMYTLHAYDLDADKWLSEIAVTRNDGKLTIGDFYIGSFEYDQSTETWKDEGNVEAYYYNVSGNVSTGIDGVHSNAIEHEIVGYYDLQGHKHNSAMKGLNIIKYSDGTNRKVYMK